MSVLGEKEFEQALRDKLIEEAKEAATAPINDLVTEIADGVAPL
ncbi:hypothetical protein KSC_039890 [Ktedonobacter sp. SOSP1-52]|nr:hypothetical protein KSC_039890 [Ktedonobacter sp. SOSP1-52]